MKKLSLIMILTMSLSVIGQTKFYTISTTQVGTGMTHYKVIAPLVPWSLDVLEIDLKNPYNKIQTVKAQEKMNYGTETVRSMAARYNKEGQTVVAAINGDFYSAVNTIGMQISNGEVVKDHGGSHTLALDSHNRPVLFKADFFGKILFKDHSTDLHCINRPRDVIAQWFPHLLTNRMVLFNHYFGSSTGTNEGQVELLLQPLQRWMVNDTIACVVQQKQVGGNMAIPAGGVVLSGLGTAAEFIHTYLAVGDTIRVVPQLNIDLPQIKELIGGLPKFIVNGVDYTDQGWREMNYQPSHVPQRHPRTAIGFSQDSTRLFFVTVDGRQPNHSIGMTLYELADFMIKWGVYHALNLDGGGSTTMVVQGAVVNSVSDPTERSVQNAVLALSTAPRSSLAHIQISPDYYRLFLGEKLAFKVSGWDEYYHPIEIDQSQLQFSTTCGTIDAKGLFTASMESDSGYVFARYGDYQDSACVIIKGIARLKISPKDVVADTLKSIKFRVTAYDTDDMQRFLSPNRYLWQVADPTIAFIDSLGNLKARKAGTTKVIAAYGAIADTAIVNVVIGVGDTLLASCENLTGWKLSGENIVLSASTLSIAHDVYSQGAGSFKIDYQYIGDPQKINYIHLLTDIPIYGIPDSIFIDAKTDGKKHHIQYIFSDDNGELFQLATKKYASQVDRFDSIPAKISEASQLVSGSTFYFPIRLKQVNIKLAGDRVKDVVYRSTLYLDNLRITYPAATAVKETPTPSPETFILEQNFPNPFNATTTFQFYLPKATSVSLAIFDLMGRRVAVLIDQKMAAGSHRHLWDASNLPSGVYFYRLAAEGTAIQSRKLLLLR